MTIEPRSGFTISCDDDEHQGPNRITWYLATETAVERDMRTAGWELVNEDHGDRCPICVARSILNASTAAEGLRVVDGQA